MKKNIGMLALIMCGICLIPACTNPPIFAAIEQEVKLKPASIKGCVYKMVRLDNTLFAANGALFTKDMGKPGTWGNIGGAGGRCIGLAEDDDNLYGLFGDNDSFKVYKADKNGANWVAVTGMDSADFLAGTKTVFAADTGSKKMYVLSTTSVTTPWTLPDGSIPPVGAAYKYCLLGNGLYTEAGALVNGSPITDLKGICEGPNNTVFVLDASHLHCYTGSAWSKIAHNVTSPQSITYLPRKRLVLIGGKNGYGEIKLPESGTDLNAAKPVEAGTDNSSIKNYHQYKNSVGKWSLNSIMAFDDNSASTDRYIIYAGALDTNATYSGLWGFYYDQQIEWNRE